MYNRGSTWIDDTRVCPPCKSLMTDAIRDFQRFSNNVELDALKSELIKLKVTKFRELHVYEERRVNISG